MARTTLAAQDVSGAAPLAPLTLAPVDATNGNQWTYTGRRRLIVHNGSGASVTATVRTPAVVALAGLDVPDRPVSVPAGGYAFIVESPEARQADGMVYIDWSAGASVEAALVDEQ